MLTKQNRSFCSPDGFASNINIQISIEHFVIIKAINVFCFWHDPQQKRKVHHYVKKDECWIWFFEEYVMHKNYFFDIVCL